MLALFMSLTFVPLRMNAETNVILTSTASNRIVDSAQANALIGRLNEIKVMDKSNLSSFEKRELRKETRSIKKNLRQLGGGVYLSAGAIIIIVLLLILLL